MGFEVFSSRYRFCIGLDGEAVQVLNLALIAVNLGHVSLE
jgi:hypothetical protein